jgi:uncharacterized membrane protein YbhN (UPF0104 family)
MSLPTTREQVIPDARPDARPLARLWKVAASRRVRPDLRLVLRLVLGAGVLVAVLAHVGAAPFLHGLAALDAPTLGAAVALTALATAAAAWRWGIISRALGVPLRWRSAVAMYYRSQLLNSVLPGGVIGDVGRAVDHGRSVERLGPAARAVAIERGVGQVVQLALAIPVIIAAGMGIAGGLLPSLALVAAGVAVVAAVVTALAGARVRHLLRREAAELRTALGSGAALAQTVIASVVVCLCHVATFVVAAIAVGAQAPALRLVALGFVVLLAASLPVGVGGWGPREGAAGWAFAATGLSASTGVAAATLFGVLALLSVAPGAVPAAAVRAALRPAALRPAARVATRRPRP